MEWIKISEIMEKYETIAINVKPGTSLKVKRNRDDLSKHNAGTYKYTDPFYIQSVTVTCKLDKQV